MKKTLGIITLIMSCYAFGGIDVGDTTVNYVYQLDSEATTFEFYSSKPNNCGSHLYRVKSPNEAVANRKFSLVLTAFTANKKLGFHDTQICEGYRSIVSWVRLTN